MKTICNLRALASLSEDLVKFIKRISPWIQDEWDPQAIGYIFVLNLEDAYLQKTICTVPHAPFDDIQYIASMTIDLETYDLWESPSYFDEVSGYWNVVAILGGDYGCSLFMSAEFVHSLPRLHQTLKDLQHIGPTYQQHYR